MGDDFVPDAASISFSDLFVDPPEEFNRAPDLSWADLRRLYEAFVWLAFHFGHYRNYFCLPPTLSAFFMAKFHDADTFLLNQWSLASQRSALTRFESLSLVFQLSHHRPTRTTPPPHTRTLLPALTYLQFGGVPEYLEELVAQIDAPLLDSMTIDLWQPQVFEVTELAKFVRRADKLSLADRAEATFDTDSVFITFSPELLGERVDPKTFTLYPETSRSHLRLSNLARFCTSCLPTTSPFETLCIFSPCEGSWQGTIDDSDPRWWLELLRPFTSVKDLHLSPDVVLHVAQALPGLPVERVTEVLPALGNVVIPGLGDFGPLKEAIYEFAAARQVSGHPVSIQD